LKLKKFLNKNLNYSLRLLYFLYDFVFSLDGSYSRNMSPIINHKVVYRLDLCSYYLLIYLKHNWEVLLKNPKKGTVSVSHTPS